MMDGQGREAMHEGNAEPKGAERRVHPRKEILTKVDYTCEGRRFFGKTIDLSRGGMCLETFFAHKIGQELALLFRVFEGRDPIVVRGEVCWVREMEKGKNPAQVLRKRRVGVRFTDVEEAMFRKMNYYLVDEMLFR
jgi:Tfp pilus assembly protein PilZ